MKVYFEDNEKMGEIKNTLIDKDGVTIIVSTEDDKRYKYKVKLNDDDAKLLMHMKSIKDYVVNDISGIIIKTNDVEEIPIRGKRREAGIIDEDYSSYWKRPKVPHETKTSLYIHGEFINKDFPIEYDIPCLSVMDYDDYDIEFKSEISNKYSDVNPYITIGSTDCGKIVKIGDEVSIKNLIEFRKSNKITICTQEEIPFKLRFSITVKKFKWNK